MLSLAYEISESSTAIFVVVALPPQLPPTDIEITLTDSYLSLIAPSHQLVLDFAHRVSPQNSVCRAKKQQLRLEIQKGADGSWGEIVRHLAQSEQLAVRNAAFQRLQLQNQQLARESNDIKAQAQHEAEEKQMLGRQQERNEMRLLKQRQIDDAKRILTSNFDPKTAAIQQLPEPRNSNTVSLTATFTKRKYAVPARDNRDMYFDDQTGPIIPDIKSQPVQIMLKQAKNYANRPTPEFESALDLCAQIIQKAPLFMDATVFMSQIYLRKGQFDDSLILTSQMMKIVEISTKFSSNRANRVTFSRELQSKIHAMHAASLCGGGKVREGLKYMESASQLNKTSRGLLRDVEVMRRVVGLVNQ
uniref:CS domain-containing protein n=1 Tax=Spironucleus salmonicida TaxID=348837 RepID=V6LRM2_9EUKA|eukprot:EST47307.1 hypothetical protein SS50377_12625 [Spironucleus salmonicida]